MVKVKKYFFLILFSITVNTWAGINKLDPQLGLLVLYPQRLELMQQQSTLKKSADGFYIDAIITFDGNKKALYDNGVKLICIRDNMAIASIPVNRVLLSAISRALRFPRW